jgi:uncharacterized protein (DUF488 family)
MHVMEFSRVPFSLPFSFVLSSVRRYTAFNDLLVASVGEMRPDLP